MVASSTRRSSTSAHFRSHNTRNANLRNKPLLNFKQPASWKSWERSASAELDILHLLDAVTFDAPSYEWVCDNHPELHPEHDADMLTSMLEAASEKHFIDARAAYNHLIEWIMLESKPGLANQIDRMLAPTRDGPGLWKLILNHISTHERSQQLRAGGLWADIHARSFDLDGSKGTTSPFQEHLSADEIHDIITGITDTWTSLVGNEEAHASECVFTILRLLQRRPDLATFARETEREYRRMEASAKPIDLTLATKYITDELEVQLPHTAASATGNLVFDSIFELGPASSPLDAGASMHRMQPDRARSGPPRRDDRARSGPFRNDDTRGGLSRTNPRPGDGRQPRSPMNNCPFCISKLCPARAGAKCEECIVHNSDIKLPPWASESNLKHLGIAMLYAKENPNTKSFKTIDVIDWALRKLSAPMLKARRRSAGDNMLAPFLEPDDGSEEDPELSELAESDALRALYDEQGTEPAFRATSELQINQNAAPHSTDAEVNLSNLDQPSLDAHATALIDDIDSSVTPASDSHFAHTGRMHVLLSAGHSIDHSLLSDFSPRIAMMASTDSSSPAGKGSQRPVAHSFGRGRGAPRLVTNSFVNSHADAPTANDVNSTALVAPRMSAGAKPFSQAGKQRPVNPGHYRSMFKPTATTHSSAALSAMQRISSQQSGSLRIQRYQRDDELVRVRSLSDALAPASAQSCGNDGSLASTTQFAHAATAPASSCDTHDQHDSGHVLHTAAAQSSAGSCAATHGQHDSNRTAHDAAAPPSVPAFATDHGNMPDPVRQIASVSSRLDDTDLIVNQHCDDLLDLRHQIADMPSTHESLASRLDKIEKHLTRGEQADNDFKTETHAQLLATNNRFDALTAGIDDIGILSALQATIATLATRLDALDSQSKAAACAVPAASLHTDNRDTHPTSERTASPPFLAPITARQDILDESVRALEMTVSRLRTDHSSVIDDIAKLRSDRSSDDSTQLPALYRVVSPDVTMARLDSLETGVTELRTRLASAPAVVKIGSWADSSDDALRIQSLCDQTASHASTIQGLTAKMLTVETAVSMTDTALRERVGSLDTRLTSCESDMHSLLDPSGHHFTMLDDVVCSINERHRTHTQDIEGMTARTTTLESSLANCLQRLHLQSHNLDDMRRDVRSLRERVPLHHSSPSGSMDSVDLVQSNIGAPSSPSESYVPLQLLDAAEHKDMSVYQAAACYVQAHARGRSARNSYRNALLAARTLQAHARAKPWRLWISAALSEQREFQIVADLHRDFTAMIHTDARLLTPTRRSPRTNSGVIYRYSPSTLSHFQQPAMRA